MLVRVWSNQNARTGGNIKWHNHFKELCGSFLQSLIYIYLQTWYSILGIYQE